MLTPEQVKTVDFNARFIIDGHLATLHGVSNRVLHELTPSNKHEYGKHFETLVSETIEVIYALGERAAHEVPQAVLALKTELNEQDRDEVLAIWQGHLAPDLYRKRIEAFKESFGRRMQGYGTAVQLSTFRFDLIESRYLAGTANASRLVVAKLKHALDLRVYADRVQPEHQPPTSFLEKANEVVDLKPNLFGLGLNINKLIEHFFRRAQRKPATHRNIIARKTHGFAVSEFEKPLPGQPPELGPEPPADPTPDRTTPSASHSIVCADGKVTPVQSSINRKLAIPLIQIREPSPAFDDRYELLNPDHRHLLSLSRRPLGITLGEIRAVLAIEQSRLEAALRYLEEQELVDQATDDVGKVRWRLSEAGHKFLEENPWARWV